MGAAGAERASDAEIRERMTVILPAAPRLIAARLRRALGWPSDEPWRFIAFFALCRLAKADEDKPRPRWLRAANFALLRPHGLWFRRA